MGKKAIAKAEAAELTLASQYAEFDGAGYEGDTSDDVQIPLLNLLQALSPECQEGGDDAIDGARPGLFINSVTKRVYGPEVLFVPSCKERVFVEWRSRKHGGGFVERHDRNSDFVRRAIEAAGSRFGKIPNPDDVTKELVDTVYLYGILVDEDGGAEQIVVPLCSTKLAPYRRWNTTLKTFTLRTEDGRKVRPPLFAHETRIGRRSQTNSEGTFYNVDFSPARGEIKSSLLSSDDPLFGAARDLAELVSAGRASAAQEGREDDASDGGDAF